MVAESEDAREPACRAVILRAVRSQADESRVSTETRPQAIDQLVHPRWLLPVEPADLVLEGHSIAIDAGRIVALGPRAELEARFNPASELALPAHVLMPGLVNAHGHAAMTLLRGYADDHTLMSWLQDYIWPAEGRWVGSDFVRAGSRIAIAEMLRSGTTCFADMYFFPDATAEAVIESGIRAQLSMPVIEFRSAWASDADDYLAKGLEVRDRFKAAPRLAFAFGPHAPYTTSDAILGRIAVLAAELDAAVHMHVHETAHEVAESIALHGRRPLARLDALGLLSPRFQAVHMTQVDAADLELLGRHRVHVVHCPSSNMKLAAGACPVRRLLDAGINVAVGSDGAASNNTLDLFAETRLAALLAKLGSSDPCALSAHAAVRMATLRGAEALGLGDRIGSLLPGKQADMIAVSMDRIECEPVYDIHSALVYAASGGAVSHAWVDGRLLLAQGALLTLDHDDLLEQARAWRRRIRPE